MQTYKFPNDQKVLKNSIVLLPFSSFTISPPYTFKVYHNTFSFIISLLLQVAKLLYMSIVKSSGYTPVGLWRYLKQWKLNLPHKFRGGMPKIAIHLPRTYEKLTCKRELYWFKSNTFKDLVTFIEGWFQQNNNKNINKVSVLKDVLLIVQIINV